MPKIAEEARAARRDQIIAAAAGCFARSGYHLITMADIAEAASVSKGTPYLYFPGKEALFIALGVDAGEGQHVLAGQQRRPPSLRPGSRPSHWRSLAAPRGTVG